MPFDRDRLAKPLPTRRVNLRRSRTGWTIVGDKAVGKTVLPAHHDLPKVDRGTAVAGSWIELFDEAGTVLYRAASSSRTAPRRFGERARPVVSASPSRSSRSLRS